MNVDKNVHAAFRKHLEQLQWKRLPEERFYSTSSQIHPLAQGDQRLTPNASQIRSEAVVTIWNFKGTTT